MAKNKIDIIIEAVRAHLKEDAPINNVGSGNIAGTSEAGDDPPVDLRKKKRRNWNPFFKDLARVQRRRGK
jgi:hypothetical protein